MKFNNLFFYKVYQQWPALFYVCCVLVLGTLISGFVIGQSVSPFHVYQMYSQPIPSSEVGNTARIYINNKELNTFLIYQETGDIIRTNMNRLLYLENSGFKDKYFYKLKETGIGKFIPEICYQKVLSFKKQPHQAYANWLKNYLQNFVKEDIKSLALSNQYYQYNKQGQPIIVKEIPVFKFSYE